MAIDLALISAARVKGFMQNVIQPFSLRYDGNETTKNLIDVSQLGRSLSGASRIYNATLHFCAFGNVPRGNYTKYASAFTTAPRAGCYEAIILMGLTATQNPALIELSRDGLSKIFFHILGALKKTWINDDQTENINNTVQSLLEAADNDRETRNTLVNGVIQSNADFAELLKISLTNNLPELSRACRSAARDLVDPVGKSCSLLSHHTDHQMVCEISEPEAYVIKSRNQEDLGDMQKFICESITEVNRNTGHCEMRIRGVDRPIKGKITDPALSQVGNIYTQALDQKTSFSFSAKPVNKDGELHKVFISDAGELES